MAIEKTNVFVIQKLELLKQVLSTQMSKEVQKSLFENPDLYGGLMSNAMRATFGDCKYILLVFKSKFCNSCSKNK